LFAFVDREEIEMKTQLLYRIGLFLALACMSFAGSGAAAAQSGGVRNAEYGGVSFRYDASLASGVEGKLVPETIGGGDTAWWMAMPQHLELTLTDFHGSNRPYPAVIYVFPVLSDYGYLTPGNNQDVWLPSVQQLQEILSKHHDLRMTIEQSATSPNQSFWLPYLPPINAVTTPVGKASYYNFTNGKGIRYLVHIAQDVSPPDATSTFYTFQGLTDDGKYYVAATFAAFPPAMQPIPLFQSGDIRDYYRGLMDQFDRISNDAYAPNLDLLEKMMGSLSVEPTELGVLPGMPKTGASDQAANLLAIAATLLVASGLFLMRRSMRV
jgi:LPXTG-motif cell wall-anchored protein